MYYYGSKMIKMFSDQDTMIKPSSIARQDEVIKDEKDNFKVYEKRRKL